MRTKKKAAVAKPTSAERGKEKEKILPPREKLSGTDQKKKGPEESFSIRGKKKEKKVLEKKTLNLLLRPCKERKKEKKEKKTPRH